MVTSMILAAVLALSVAAVPPLPVVRAHSADAPRYVRLRLDVVAYGIPGRGEILIDRRTGRFVRRFAAGPASDREGFDGVHAWRADATGMARIQGNADQRSAVVGASYLFARAPRPLSSRPLGQGRSRVVYRGVSRGIDLTTGPPSGLLAAARRPVGEDVLTTTFDDVRSVAGFSIPFAIDETSDNGRWSARVRTVETPRQVADAAFAPPPAPHDATLSGVTSIALSGDLLFPGRIDDGPPLRFVLDTGGQNVITPQAARRLGLRIVGEGEVGGAGAGLTAIRLTTARRVRVGAAEMRDQPFLVLELGPGVAFDGIVGYELLARFAARLDIAHHRLQLAPRAEAFGRRGTAVPMTFDERQPQVQGAIDGIPAALTLDTGSVEAIDVYTPFVRANRLAQRYPVTPRGMLYAGVGGEVDGWRARARTVRMGAVTMHDVRLALTDARAGVEINPSVAANVGTQVLRRFAIVFDYRSRMLRFEPI